MKPVCRPCFLRLHPLGYDECPIGVHVLSDSEPCESSVHELTDVAMANLRYLGIFPSMGASV